MTSHSSFKGRFSKVAWATALLCSSPMFVHALPTGGIVTTGVVNISANALQTTIQQSTSNATINWSSFNVSAGENVRVFQPNAQSVLLNRVVGAQPSEIFGKLSANGQVFLMNPNGILFGAGSSVNTAGLVATTLNLTDADVSAGSYRFAGVSKAAVVNQGSLNADGAYVALLGAHVDNQGAIQARSGSVVLAAGQALSMDLLGDGLLNVRITEGALNALAQNGGLIQADGGKILLTAQAAGELVHSVVNTAGLLQAQTLESRNGTISLLALGSQGVASVSGTIDVSGASAGLGGGHVDVQGTQVHVADARIVADAHTSGNGGQVLIKATDFTHASGVISVRGGVLGGNGGLIETSAAQLNVSGLLVDARAPQGKTGTWLLDPADVTIFSAATINESLSGNVFAPVSGVATSNINVADLVVALNAANVVVTTENTATGGAGLGDIHVNAAVTWTGANSLSLNAVRDVNVNQAITATNGSLLVNAGRDVNVNLLAALTITTGNLEFTAVRDVNVSAATTITTGHLNAIAGGDIKISAASTITGGNMLLRADSDGTGPGVVGGTVNITCGSNCITLTNGVLSIRFNPASESTLSTELLAYDAHLTGAAHSLDAKAWMFAKGVDKPYDANTSATLTLAGGPTGALLMPGTAHFTSKDVASPQDIVFSGYTTSASGTDHLLWSPLNAATGTGTTRANITAIPLTITANGDQKNVNGLPYSGGNGVTYTAFVGGETPADLGGSLAYGGSSQGAVNVGTYQIVPSGRTSSNYAITYAAGILSIDGQSLVITPTNVSKIFGQTASLTGFTVVGLLNGDTVTSVVESSAGTPPSASVAGGPYAIVASGATGSLVPGNYNISYVNGTLTVLPAPLSITANNTAKAYGQTATLPVTGFTSLGLVNGDTVTSVVQTSSGTAASAPVAGNPYLIVPSGALGTLVPGNYSITYVNGALTVAPASLIVTADNASKTYGQTATLSSQAFTSAGLVNGDVIGSVQVASEGAPASANVASGPYAITPSAAAGGFVPGNYSITYVNGVLTLVPAPLTVTALDASKIYGQTAVLPVTGFTSQGLVNGDTITQVTNHSPGEVATAPVAGNPYFITPSAATGNLMPSNYRISYVDGALTITPVPLIITANNAAKAYGQTATLAVTGFTSLGLVNGDTVTSVVQTSSGTAASAPVAGNPYLIVPSGALGTLVPGNYSITYVNGALTVAPASLIVTADNASKTYGQTVTLSSQAFTSAGLVNGDVIGSVQVASEGAPASVNVASGPYAITPSGATGGFVPGNYSVTYVNGVMTVVPAPLTVTALDVSKIYGQTAVLPVTGFTSQGLVNGDTITQVTNHSPGEVATAPVAGNPYLITPSAATGSLVSSNYRISYVDGALTITPAPLIITANDVTKTYGQTIVLPGTIFVTQGLVNGDRVSSVTETSTGQLPAALPGTSYPIVLSQPKGSEFVASNYSIALVDGALTVIAMPQVIPSGHSFDAPVLPRNDGRDVLPELSTAVYPPPELGTLKPDEVIAPVAPVQAVEPVVPLTPVVPVVTPLKPQTPASPVLTPERPLPVQPVRSRPRKQDRN